MRDYELTVEELNNKLTEKNNLITSLESEVEREKGRCSSLQEQLSHLTTQEATERERAEKMKVRTTLALPPFFTAIPLLHQTLVSHLLQVLCLPRLLQLALLSLSP